MSIPKEFINLSGGEGSSIKPGMLIELKEVQFRRNAYGPVMVLCCWAKDEAEPLYLVSNLSSAEEAIQYYKKRFRIETFFSDQKSRGFNIQKSHIEDPQRLSRLLIASCLAYHCARRKCFNLLKNKM
jgi:hypothetical protein